MDRTDRNFRKFEYDDERKYGNPPAQMFKVLYEESGLFGEVLCSNVISIKKSNNTHNHFLDIPIYNNDVKKDEVSKSTVALSEDVNELGKILETPIEKKKSKTSSKTKSKTTVLKGETIEYKEFTPDVSNVSTKPKLYEYDILVVDNISNTDNVKSKLNEYGKEGWEVCGFQMNQRIFGGCCQAVIIMKKGLN